MPLLALWSSAPEQVGALSIQQIVATAGDGKLGDDSECSRELREFLSQVHSDKLVDYAQHCLDVGFDNSGFVLQDIVNELGRRLDYRVVNGRYRGVSNKPGNDGLWKAPEEREVIVEVRTTDTYQLSLSRIAGYRDRLRQEGTIGTECSMLVVVGRHETDDLEAQVRGSRHAWDTRIISVKALLQLVRLKESTESSQTARKIREILVPFETTRLDSLVEVLLTTAQDVEETFVAATAMSSADDPETSKSAIIDPTSVQLTRDRIVDVFATKHGKKLIRTSRAVYWDAAHTFRVVCTVSKRYSRRPSETYWYAYRTNWNLFLTEADTGYFLLGCTDLDIAFAIPIQVLSEHLEELNTTTRDDGSSYWHISVAHRGSDFILHLPKARGKKHLSLSAFAFKLL
jgi:hypothetical protein